MKRYTKKGKENNYVFPKQIEQKKEEEKVNEGDWIEDDGIIYSSVIGSPPRYESGVTSLNSYLEHTVKVYPGDKRVFEDRSATILYKVKIDENGKINAVSVDRSCVTTGGFDDHSRALEEEIGAVVSYMPNWKPAIVNGENTAVFFYLPIRFKLNGPRIFVLSSKNVFTFKDRG